MAATPGTLAQALQSLFVVVRDVNTGVVSRVAVPADFQVGTAGNPAELMLTGRLSLNETSFTSTVANQGTIGIANNDTIAGINLGNFPLSGSVIVAKLPSAPRDGQVHIIKDETGTAQSWANIQVTPAQGYLIDGQPTKSITTDYGSMMVAWWDNGWFTIGGGGAGGGSQGPPGPSGSKGDTGATGPQGPSGSIGPPAQPYQTVFDLDFTAQGSQLLSTDGTYTIGGWSFIKENSANDGTPMKVIPGVGLQIDPLYSGSNTTNYNFAVGNFGSTYRNCPLLSLVLGQIPALENMSWQSKLRIWCALTPDPSVTDDAMVFVAIDSGPNSMSLNGGGIEIAVGEGVNDQSAAGAVNTAISYGNSNINNIGLAYTNVPSFTSANSTVLLELDRVDGGSNPWVGFGPYVGNDWPTYFQLSRANSPFTAVNNQLGQFIVDNAPGDPRLMRVALGAAVNQNLVPPMSIQRLRIDVLVIEASVTSGSIDTLSGSIFLQENGTPVGAGPFDTLDFVGATVTDLGGGVAEINITGSSGVSSVLGTGGSSVSNVGSVYTVSSSMGADLQSSYIVVALDAENPNERKLAVTGGTSLNDGGAGGNLTLSSSVGADKFATYILVSPNANDTKARTLAAGTGISFADAGAGSTFTVSATAGGANPWTGTSDIYTTSSVSIDGGGQTAPQHGTDTYFYASGTIGLAGAGSKHAVFGGDVLVSGTLTALVGLSGSLTQLAGNKGAFIVGQGSVFVSTNSLGQVIVSGSGGSGGSSVTVVGAGGTTVTGTGSPYTVSSSIGAFASSSFLVAALDAENPNERRVIGLGGTTVSDQGAGSTFTVSSSIYAFASASYVVVGADAENPRERVLTAGTNVTFADGGPGGTLTINASTGSAGSAGHFVVPLSFTVSSTGNDATNPKKVGGIGYNPAVWNQLSNTSTIVFHVLLETTNASNVVSGSLVQFTGTGSPQTLAIVSTGSLTTAELTANVSTFFRPAGNAGIFLVDLNLTTNNGTDYGTSTAAWLDFTP